MNYQEIKSIDDLDDVELKPVIIPDAEDYRAVWNSRTEKTISIVSSSYALVPHKVVARFIMEKYPGTSIMVSEDQSKMFGFITFMEKKVEVVKGDYVSMGLRFCNSYNRSASLSAELFANRLICNNGMTIPKHLMGVKARHYIGAIDSFFEGLDNIDFIRTGNFLKSLGGKHVDEESLRGLIDASKIPAKYTKQFDFSKCDTAWDYLNAMTVVLSHRTDRCSLDRRINLEKEAMDIIQEVKEWNRSNLIV